MSIKEKLIDLEKVQKKQLLTLDLTIEKLEKIKILISELKLLGFDFENIKNK